ncbi:MAG TPA: hypothetical protein DDW27_10200 [Bacteroidales bacterium]|nr:hypothetical protein [Bacteroidales bacterium]
MKAITLSFLIVLAFYSFSNVQNKGLFEFREFQKAVNNQTRTRTGEPGARYWQNSSDYKLEARVDDSKNILSGKGSIVYHNNSPAALKDIHFRLYQDLYKRGTARSVPLPVEDLHDGTFIGSLKINGIQYMIDNKPVNQNQITIFCTDLCINLTDSIPTGSSAVIELSWNFTIPSSTEVMRHMGRYDDNFFLGQWYPQVAVYDDIRGWDDTPHLGLKEFYNDFSNFDVTVHAPDGYIVWATGECDNLNSVLDEKIIEKLNYALSHDSIVSIIAPEDHKRSIIKGNVWHFTADHVPDFAFAVAKNYLWKGTSIIADKQSGRRVLVDIVYPADSLQYSKSIVVARDALLWTSFEFPVIAFPYTHATSFFNGSRDGVSMEFPMIANDATRADHNLHTAIVAHELFHNYMPFDMGFNETLFGWMDEGWAEFLENRFKGDNYSIYEQRDLKQYVSTAGTLSDSPLITASAELSFTSFAFMYLVKPCIALMLLEELMGGETFLQAAKAFMNSWNGKHPSPYDFFYTFDRFAGGDINWFWKACYFDYGYADLGIKSVDKNKIIIERKGNIPVSIRLEMTYDDNTQEKIYRNLNVWKTGATEYPVKIKTRKNIQTIILGDKLIPDVDNSDNVYQR